MVTVIIPALNEAETIGKVIGLVKRSPIVSEIIVVDDKSHDNTVHIARDAGATVYTSTLLGKGASMREGILFSGNEFLLFLDADITTYPEDIVELMTRPLADGSADFVKSVFTRQAGRVTELVAKPLLKLLFPDLARFSQPLSGMVAGKKSMMQKLELENDYGVDIGMLIDIYLAGARIAEVNIGYIENRMQSWEQLSNMSLEVSRAIIRRGEPLQAKEGDTLRKVNTLRTQMEYAVRENRQGFTKMVIFDMDNTLLEGSFITTASRALGFEEELINIVTHNDTAIMRTKLIATLMKGHTVREVIDAADTIPVVEDALEVVTELKKNGYVCGIISDSYDIVTNHIKNKLGMDFSVANELEFSRSVATGEVKIPSYFLRTKQSQCSHEYCKSNVIRHLSSGYGIEINNITAIGDSDNDICMVRECGTGISFFSQNKYLNLVADHLITARSFKPLLDILSLKKQ
ncbi:MAG: HAD-IB family phosphatase [Bacteroidota bacterium]|nr:HAD-IB family phosphatase [Bacteroidota bacterium]